jgi:hypothetical protein
LRPAASAEPRHCERCTLRPLHRLSIYQDPFTSYACAVCGSCLLPLAFPEYPINDRGLQYSLSLQPSVSAWLWLAGCFSLSLFFFLSLFSPSLLQYWGLTSGLVHVDGLSTLSYILGWSYQKRQKLSQRRDTRTYSPIIRSG